MEAVPVVLEQRLVAVEVQDVVEPDLVVEVVHVWRYVGIIVGALTLGSHPE